VESIAREFLGLGCDAYPTSFGVVPIDVPSHVAKEAVLHALKAGQAKKRWDDDLGVDPEPDPRGACSPQALIRRGRGWLQ